jgi:hypothetical protein
VVFRFLIMEREGASMSTDVLSIVAPQGWTAHKSGGVEPDYLL